MNSAILFVIFNRPYTTKLVMDAIRAARPPRLYVAADGPRDRFGEGKLCAEARQIATSLDWPCQIHTLFREHNLGCRQAVSGAISWFFENEEEGIILEDDCVPSPSFYRFCDELLDKYRHDRRVMWISGDNFQDDVGDYSFSYSFSRYFHCWGWASWRRAWKLYDHNMDLLPEFLHGKALNALSSTRGYADYWRSIFQATYQRQIDSWAYVWTFSCWAQNGLGIAPRINLVSNIGAGSHATHTRNPKVHGVNMPAGELRFPLVHPTMMVAYEKFDDYESRIHFRIKPSKGLGSIPGRAVRKLRRLLSRYR